MKIILLGSSGFVGQNVAFVLKSNKISFTPSSASIGHNLLNLEETIKFFKRENPDYIINCAAHVGSLHYVTRLAANVINDNTRMILNIYEAISHLNKTPIIINPIANCAYPGNSNLFSEDEWMSGHVHRSVLSYGSTRRMLWSIGESYKMQFGIRSIYLFVPNMYGPFDSTNPDKTHALNALISKFVKAEIEKINTITIWGTGIAIREWLYAKDFGRILVKLINKNILGIEEPINIGQNFGLSVRELVSIINGHFNNQFSVLWDENMPDGALKKVMDDRRFRKVFPEFTFTSLDEGIKETIDYYKKIYPY
jgi:GDP-L-fucose synthase